ncbi:MAG: ABC transporter permease [Candidatus Thiodiazotropha sp. (ex Ctena orbiculata)]|uniref:ABC transporter permease n=1 Tax=Candidatus Thiodiazotropha taylori TaxID=2792791 RepID=A0A944QT88_9GAMM|nr:ABC transporter permease [Candidatus Thiodiazotropha taylori]PUB86986.1 MAG: ABC transporter permease [gamma proteobacterium symbiont of Ctena orbiculata]MBT2989703.1 ABC transporter permease [Candidatus Thiodiazotropha taylori]MBT2995957.1 ABC transporter permease [Candidatus Thiodiazotropha taylori]MBT2999273.1 ABC transporter permease [Candidatus Thiodiazotropha taylori]
MNDAVNRRQSYWRRILGQTFVRWGARLGLLWVAILALVGVFAPFLASSFPLLLSRQGEIASPVLSYLQPVDVVFLVGFITLLLLYPWRITLLRKSLVMLGVLGLSALFAYLWVKPQQLVIYEQYRVAEAAGEYDWVVYAPIPYSPKDYQRDRGDTGLEAPLSQGSRAHWFGTEQNGADVLSRMVHASRIALGIGFVATGIAMLLGVIIGGLMGYFSGVVDILGMRLVEIFEAVPTLFLLLTFVAFFGRSLYIMMVIIGITSWPGYARYVRAEFLRLRKQDFVQAAEAAGLPLPSILFRHMLPNGMGPVLVAASFGVASAILAEATLSFLGLGLVDDPSWGEMLNQAVQSSRFNWWMAAFPGGAIFLTVFAYNLIGESLRDAIDPYLSKSG